MFEPAMRRLLLPVAAFAAVSLAQVVTIVATRQAGGAPASTQQPPDRMTALQREAEALAGQEKTLLIELRQLELERDMKVEELHRVEGDVADVNAQRAGAETRVVALQGQMDVDRPALAARLVDIYKLGKPGYVRLLLDVDGVKSAARAYRAVTALAEADRRRVAAFKRTLEDLRATQRTLAEYTARAEQLQGQAQTARQAAERAVAGHAALIAEIDARRDLTARLAGEMQQAQQKLATLTPATSSEAASATSLAAARGSLDWPVAGRLTGRFGPQRDPRFGTTIVRAGIDIAAPLGQPVQAVEGGTVVYADPFNGFGNLVIIDHGVQSYSLYGHLQSLAVLRGARVARGQAVGAAGRSPAGRPDLYFELRIDGRPVDPVQWFKQR